MLTHRFETSATVRATADRVFAHVDDHARLSSHMSESSWMLGGGRMEIELDADRGKKVGSLIRLAGQAFGIELPVEEVVTEYDPPRRKVWETRGSPKLLIIDRYRMGFGISPVGNESMLHVFIEYELPAKAPARWLGRLFGRYYAKWCTQRMVDDAVKQFSAAASSLTISDTQRRSS